jgi:hypothetical protein
MGGICPQRQQQHTVFTNTVVDAPTGDHDAQRQGPSQKAYSVPAPQGAYTLPQRQDDGYTLPPPRGDSTDYKEPGAYKLPESPYILPPPQGDSNGYKVPTSEGAYTLPQRQGDGVYTLPPRQGDGAYTLPPPHSDGYTVPNSGGPVDSCPSPRGDTVPTSEIRSRKVLAAQAA